VKNQILVDFRYINDNICKLRFWELGVKPNDCIQSFCAAGLKKYLPKRIWKSLEKNPTGFKVRISNRKPKGFCVKFERRPGYNDYLYLKIGKSLLSYLSTYQLREELDLNVRRVAYLSLVKHEPDTKKKTSKARKIS